ncbi:hypothetical protein, partial [Escherichia coli]|uniref:hypothetical protein n=1 Tax=Escherichia coli TaxID=562 RepID=UPI000AF79452
KCRQNGEASEGRGNSVRPVNRATLRAVHAAGADTGKNGRKLPLRAAGYFRIPFVINTYKPEDQLFVSDIHKEGNIQVCAALNGIVSCGLEPLSIFCL